MASSVFVSSRFLLFRNTPTSTAFAPLQAELQQSILPLPTNQFAQVPNRRVPAQTFLLRRLRNAISMRGMLEPVQVADLKIQSIKLFLQRGGLELLQHLFNRYPLLTAQHILYFDNLASLQFFYQQPLAMQLFLEGIIAPQEVNVGLDILQHVLPHAVVKEVLQRQLMSLTQMKMLYEYLWSREANQLANSDKDFCHEAITINAYFALKSLLSLEVFNQLLATTTSIPVNSSGRSICRILTRITDDIVAERLLAHPVQVHAARLA